MAAVFHAKGLPAARQRVAALRARWDRELPEGMVCLQDGFAAATVSYRFPPAHWRKLRTTNGLEVRPPAGGEDDMRKILRLFGRILRVFIVIGSYVEGWYGMSSGGYDNGASHLNRDAEWRD